MSIPQRTAFWTRDTAPVPLPLPLLGPPRVVETTAKSNRMLPQHPTLDEPGKATKNSSRGAAPPLLNRLRIAETTTKSTRVPPRHPTPDEPGKAAKNSARGAALPLLRRLPDAEACVEATWAPNRRLTPDKPERVVQSRALGAARSEAHLSEASRPFWAIWPCTALRRSALPSLARV